VGGVKKLEDLIGGRVLRIRVVKFKVVATKSTRGLTINE